MKLKKTKNKPDKSKLLTGFIRSILFCFIIWMTPWSCSPGSKQEHGIETDGYSDWIKTARVFLIDAYYPPFAPEFEYDAELLATTVLDMNANVVRIGTMGKYATIQGVRFSMHPDQGDRDILAETVAACKPKGIKVIPYISTGHKLAWSMLSNDYREYAQNMCPIRLESSGKMKRC